ncbi:Uncharacterised protein [Helicobacter mustelae]|nr:Uncharacterised protein [Helicobacter mustelae]
MCKCEQELRSCAKSPLPLMDPHPCQALFFTVGGAHRDFLKHFFTLLITASAASQKRLSFANEAMTSFLEMIAIFEGMACWIFF